jgi:hypothetical protein
MRYKILVGLSGVVFLCLLMLLGPAHAQTKAHEQTKSPPLPAGMTQQQYDELVKAAGESVVETLSEKGLIARSPAPTSNLKPTEPYRTLSTGDAVTTQTAIVRHDADAQ